MSRRDYFGGGLPGGRQQFPGIRWWPVMGVYTGVDEINGFFSEPTLLSTQYDDFVLNKSVTPAGDTTKEANYLNLNDPSKRFYFTGGRKYRWRDMLKDETIGPTSRAEARDPNWGNYKWNLASWNGITGVDPIGEHMASSEVSAGKAKVSIFVATTATAERNPIPAWVMNPLNNSIYNYGGYKLWWKDDDTEGGTLPGKDHLRLDRQGAIDAMTDWLIALVRKYGADERIASIIQGEYYPNDDDNDLDGIPDWLPYADGWTLGPSNPYYPGPDTLAIYRANMVGMWSEVIRYAPRDKNGNRVNLIQSQIMTAGNDWRREDVEPVGVGSSGSGIGSNSTSGTAGFFATGAPYDLRQTVYRRVPSQHQVNPGNIGNNQKWPDGLSNPFGLNASNTPVPIEYQHVAWYFSSGGPSPLDSLYLRYQSSLSAQWHTAYEKFGPNGTHASATPGGQIPHYPQLYS